MTDRELEALKAALAERVEAIFAGTSPYLDWFLETHYIHLRAWKQ